MTKLKNILTGISLTITSTLAFSQIKPLDATLSNYQYPFEVHFLNLNSQKQNLKMAYMDVVPKKSNGKIIMLLHG
ncbi:MAG TPA: alpha/beta hydrolase, partial [Chryseobacterium sp.]